MVTFTKDCSWKRKRNAKSIKCQTAGPTSTRISSNKCKKTRLQLVKNSMSGARLRKLKGLWTISTNSACGLNTISCSRSVNLFGEWLRLHGSNGSDSRACCLRLTQNVWSVSTQPRLKRWPSWMTTHTTKFSSLRQGKVLQSLVRKSYLMGLSYLR